MIKHIIKILINYKTHKWHTWDLNPNIFT